jgi:hypothetical protein
VNLQPFKDALDRGGPFRVKVIFVSLIVGGFVLGLLPFHVREHVVFPLIWVAMHFGMLWKELKKQDSNEEPEAGQRSLVIGDSLSND